MPRLSIVISAVGNIPSLESTLVSVLENRPSDCEILVALSEPYADPYQLSGEVRFVQARRRSAMVACVNEVIGSARAPFVHLLSAACTVSDGWVEPALARFGDKRVASIAPLVVRADRARTIVAAGVGYRVGGRRRLLCHGEETVPKTPAGLVGPGGFAAFYRKSALEAAGGLSPSLGLAQADVELALTLARMGYTTALEPSAVLMANGEIEAQEASLRRGLHEERLFWRNLPERNRAAAVVAHLALVGAETLGGILRPARLPALAGRALACLQVGSYARRQAMLERLSRGASPVARAGTRFDGSHATTPSLARTTKAGISSR